MPAPQRTQGELRIDRTDVPVPERDRVKLANQQPLRVSGSVLADPEVYRSDTLHTPCPPEELVLEPASLPKMSKLIAKLLERTANIIRLGVQSFRVGTCKPWIENDRYEHWFHSPNSAK